MSYPERYIMPVSHLHQDNETGVASLVNLAWNWASHDLPSFLSGKALKITPSNVLNITFSPLFLLFGLIPLAKPLLCPHSCDPLAT